MKRSELSRAIQYTSLIIIIYIIGRTISIPWIEAYSFQTEEVGVQMFLERAMGNETGGRSILSLGLMPYMTSSIILQMFHLLTKDVKHTSQQRTYRQTLALTLVISILQAFLRCRELVFRPLGIDLWTLYLMTMTVLVGGAFFMVWLIQRNLSKGIGGQSVFILVNLLKNVRERIAVFSGEILSGQSSLILYVTLIISLIILAISMTLIILVTILTEQAEVRIPVRKVMISNSFVKDDYVAIKLNPIGTMPVMFVMTFFSIPYYILKVLDYLLRGNENVQYWVELLNLNTYVGVAVYAVMLGVLTVALAVVHVNPSDMADDMQKTGDFIIGVSPGKNTMHAFRNSVVFTAMISTLVFWVLVVLPMLLRIYVGDGNDIYLLPATIVIMTGVTLNLIEEVRTVRVLQQYELFL